MFTNSCPQRTRCPPPCGWGQVSRSAPTTPSASPASMSAPPLKSRSDYFNIWKLSSTITNPANVSGGFNYRGEDCAIPGAQVLFAGMFFMPMVIERSIFWDRFPSCFLFSCDTSEIAGGGTVTVKYILKTQVLGLFFHMFFSIAFALQKLFSFSFSLEHGASTSSKSTQDQALPFVK